MRTAFICCLAGLLVFVVSPGVRADDGAVDRPGTAAAIAEPMVEAAREIATERPDVVIRSTPLDMRRHTPAEFADWDHEKNS